MKRTPAQRLSLLAAWLFGAAPLGFGLFRAWQTGYDFRMLWMALASSVFAAALLATSIGRRRTRRAVRVQATVIFLVGMLLAGGTGFALGATANLGVWPVAFVLCFCLAVASVLVEVARPSAR